MGVGGGVGVLVKWEELAVFGKNVGLRSVN